MPLKTQTGTFAINFVPFAPLPSLNGQRNLSWMLTRLVKMNIAGPCRDLITGSLDVSIQFLQSPDGCLLVASLAGCLLILRRLQELGNIGKMATYTVIIAITAWLALVAFIAFSGHWGQTVRLVSEACLSVDPTRVQDKRWSR